jgi:hypothetical protein
MLWKLTPEEALAAEGVIEETAAGTLIGVIGIDMGVI